MSKMASKVLWQSDPVDLSEFADNTSDKICSDCGGSETYSYRGKDQWRYQSGRLLCKKCNDKQLRADKKELDLSELKLNRNEDELTFVKSTKRKKPAESKDVMKSWDDMTPDERGATRKRLEKAVNKRLIKKVKEVSIMEVYPYITGLAYETYGTCHLCGIGPGCFSSFGLRTHLITLVIPKLKTKDNVLALCGPCLKQIGRLSSAVQKNMESNGLLRNSINLRESAAWGTRNKIVRVPKDKKDTRTVYEIKEELTNEVKKELGISKDFPSF
jgi:hypothetical protein